MNRCPTIPVAPRMPTLRRSISSKNNAPSGHRHPSSSPSLEVASPARHLVAATAPNQKRHDKVGKKPQRQPLVDIDQVEHQNSWQKEPEERRNDALQMERRQYALKPSHRHRQPGQKECKDQEPQGEPVHHEGQIKVELPRTLQYFCQNRQSCTHCASALLPRFILR